MDKKYFCIYCWTKLNYNYTKETLICSKCGLQSNVNFLKSLGTIKLFYISFLRVFSVESYFCTNEYTKKLTLNFHTIPFLGKKILVWKFIYIIFEKLKGDKNAKLQKETYEIKNIRR